MIRNEGNRLRLRKLRDWGVRVRFQAELGKLYEEASGCGGEDVETVSSYPACNRVVVIDRVLPPVIIETWKPDDAHEYHESHVCT